jgi:hypothetical protein
MLELLKLGNIKINSKIVDLIYYQFCIKRTFMEAISKTLVIDKDNLETYNKFIDIYYTIRFSVTELSYVTSQ